MPASIGLVLQAGIHLLNTVDSSDQECSRTLESFSISYSGRLTPSGHAFHKLLGLMTALCYSRIMTQHAFRNFSIVMLHAHQQPSPPSLICNAECIVTIVKKLMCNVRDRFQHLSMVSKMLIFVSQWFSYPKAHFYEVLLIFQLLWIFKSYSFVLMRPDAFVSISFHRVSR